VRYWYVVAATGWAAAAYLVSSTSVAYFDTLRLLSWIPAAILVALIVEQARRKPSQLAGPPGPAAPAGSSSAGLTSTGQAAGGFAAAISGRPGVGARAAPCCARSSG
jgi:hypothetical protein